MFMFTLGLAIQLSLVDNRLGREGEREARSLQPTNLQESRSFRFIKQLKPCLKCEALSLSLFSPPLSMETRQA